MEQVREQFALSNPISIITGKSPENLTREDIIDIIISQKIERITFLYTSIEGKLRELRIPIADRNQAELVLTEGERVDGSSLFKNILDASNSDLYVVPVYKTAFINPFDDKSLNIICRFFNSDGELAEFAPDNILDKAVKLLKERSGKDLYALGELEFYLIGENNNNLYPLEKQRGYHATAPFTKTSQIIHEMLRYITQITGKIKYAHNEVGYLEKIESDFPELNGKQAEQVEIEFLPAPATDMADYLVIATWIIRNVASKHGYIASFFPKIDVGHAGNGLHFHMMLLENGKNVLVDDKNELSETARMLIGGLCHYAVNLTAFGNMVSSSYLRLVPNQEAPTRVCWSESNRSAMIRVPLAWNKAQNLAQAINESTFTPLIDEPQRQTVELRSPDGSANVHLLLAGIAMAVEWGLSNQKESLNLAERSHVSVNIHQSPLDLDLAELATSCTESGEKLLQFRQMFERDNIFPNAIINYVANVLENENDRNLNVRLLALPKEEMLFQSRRIMHKDLHKH